MTQAFMLLITTFGLVFFLGLQSLSVNTGHRLLAVINSLVIGTLNLFLFKTVPVVHEPLHVAAYLLGGPLGIVTAMIVHPRIAAYLRRH